MSRADDGKRLLFLIPIVLGLLAVTGLLLSAGNLLNNIDSDFLYPVSMYRDLFVDHYDVTQWKVTPAPYFFPDMAVFFPLLGLTPDVGYAFTMYSIVVFLVLFGSLMAITHNMNRNALVSSIWILSSLLLMVSLCLKAEYARLLCHFFYPAFHSGSTIIGIILIALALRIAKKKRPIISMAIFVALASLTVFSDMSIVPQFLLPLAVTSLVLVFLKLMERKAGLTISALSVCGILLGAVLKKLPGALNLFIIPAASDKATIDPSVTLANLLKISRDMICYARSYQVLFVILCVWLIVCACLLFRNRRLFFAGNEAPNDETDTNRALVFLMIVSILSVLGTLTAPAVINRWAPWYVMTYIHPVSALPLFTLAIIVPAAGERSRHLLKIFTVGVVAFAVSQFVQATGGFQLSTLRLPYPRNVQLVDEVADEFGLRYGYGDYWLAKYMDNTSRAGVRVNQVKRDWSIDYWINNLSWYYGKSGDVDGRDYPCYSFILFKPALAPEVEAKFGEPAHKEYGHSIEIYIYDREDDVAFRNFLRIPAMLALGMDLPSSPVEPERLGSYTPNDTPRNSADTFVIPEGGDLIVRFDPPAAGSIMEIAADGDDTYTFELFMDDQGMGEMIAPPASKKGIQIRYLWLPDSARMKPIDRLVIHPAGGDDRYVLGHIYIYEDACH